MNKSMIQLMTLITTICILIINGIGGLIGVGDIIHTTTEPDVSTRRKTTSAYVTSSTTLPIIETVDPTTPESPATVAFALTQTNFGGGGIDNFWGACGTNDGGYAVIGTTTSTDGAFEESYLNFATPYSFINKYAANGALEWTRCIGETDEPVYLTDVTAVSDGGIVAVGYSASATFGNDFSVHMLIMKYSNTGSLIWMKSLGGTGFDMFNCVAATSDGFVCGGKTSSKNGTFAGLTGSSAVIVYFDQNGERLHTISYSSNKGGNITDISTDSNDNVFATLVTNSTTGDFASFTGLKGGYNDSIVLKFNSEKTLDWYYVIASSGRDNFESVAADGEGGCAVAGYYEPTSSSSPDGSLSGITNYGGADGLVIKLSKNGKKSWSKSIAGFAADYVTDIIRIRGGYAVSVYTSSSNRDFTNGNAGGTDAYVFVLTPSGTVISTSTHAGSKDETMYCLAPSIGSGFAAFGQSISDDRGFDGLYVEGSEDSYRFFKCFMSVYKVIY